MSALPLAGLRVLDFTTLLPGPLATLMLAEAGAEVIKIERPSGGDEMRSYEPKLGRYSANFAMLNRGKRSIAIDLKAAGSLDILRPLIKSSDILIEQFRPGVMSRLGMDFPAVSAINPSLIYCSLSGYGQTGGRRDQAGHDLNYVAASGLLSLVAGESGQPVLPHALIADIGGGAYPAFMNIVLALRQRDVTGKGTYLDVAMADNLFPFLYWPMASGFSENVWPRPSGELVTGGSPRYALYRTSDSRFIAAAPIEERFWGQFCDLINLPFNWRDDAPDPKGTRQAVQDCIEKKTATEWLTILGPRDVCCNVVASMEEALQDPAFVQRGLFASKVSMDERSIPALPLPIVSSLRSTEQKRPAPPLGEANSLLSNNIG